HSTNPLKFDTLPELVMTKADLIAVVADKLKFPWARAELLVDQIFSCMTQALQHGEGIEIRGFGSFTVRDYKAYEGRNPRTGDTVHVRPKRLAFFKVGKELRERVNLSRTAATSNANPTSSQPSNPRPSD
ncbi:MAG TPA: HU family DNA-binding protein, partial [Polyangia bacterium]